MTESAITHEDRLRVFRMYNENKLSWGDFWEEWTDDDIELLMFHGG